jgi:hypothetical protein
MTDPVDDNWNFDTFEKYINQRFSDLSLQLRERYEAQQIGLTAALAAAEKAVNAALVAAEKAVDKAEGAQQLRNESQNEFRKSLSDLSGLMWTTKEGTAVVEAMRRELTIMLKTVEAKVGILESSYANMQGRIWAISAMFSLVVLLIDVGIRFMPIVHPYPEVSAQNGMSSSLASTDFFHGRQANADWNGRHKSRHHCRRFSRSMSS